MDFDGIADSGESCAVASAYQSLLKSHVKIEKQEKYSMMVVVVRNKSSLGTAVCLRKVNCSQTP